jgi:Zn-finger nucleic acid-binding protein
MRIEALNCPNCGAAVADDSAACAHCKSRLKTMSCSHCFETIFEGSNFCPLCGASAVAPIGVNDRVTGDCPRCRRRLNAIEIEGVFLDECERCFGAWSDLDTFERICSERERQAAILKRFGDKAESDRTVEIRYVPCPVCGQLMNRSNFARVSGVVIDTCKPHGVWFDEQELPRIIEFIKKGGLDIAREKEKAQIAEERSRLKQEKFTAAVDRFKAEKSGGYRSGGSVSAIREFINFLLD